VKWGWLQSAPTKRATPPSVYRKRRKAITVAELQALVRAAEASAGKGSSLATAIAFGALTGARRGELTALRWSDWDGAESLHIARALTVLKGGKVIEGPTKTHQERVVVLDAVGRAALAARRKAQELQASAKEAELVADPFILSRDADGSKPYLPDTLSHDFSEVVERLWPRPLKDGKPAGVPRFHVHDLRHFVATVALASGASPRTVADRLGHADVSMTLNVYGHAIDEASRELADFLGGVFAPKEEDTDRQLARAADASLPFLALPAATMEP
jgi:integrase